MKANAALAAVCLLPLWSATAWTQTVVRLAVSEGRARVVAAGTIRVVDGDVGDVLLPAHRGELLLTPVPDGLMVPGVKHALRTVLLSARDSLTIDGRRLVGAVEVLRDRQGLTVVNRLPLERYLQGVLGAEMGGSWPLEALKAQAVAARTFFSHRRLSREDLAYDLAASTLDQVYKGIARETARTREAVSKTRGEVLTWNNAPAEALFHACCGGRSRSAEQVFGGAVPYLKEVSDPDCGACPKHRWTRTVPASELVAKLGPGFGKSLLRISLDGETLSLVGERGRRTLDRATLRRKLGAVRIPSGQFTLRLVGDELRFEGRGSGHGVGMCQWGARGMAERGMTYKQILARYYPGCELRRMY